VGIQLDVQQAMAAVNDRNTTATTLQAIADQHHDLWAQVASHPNAYPALLDWLDSEGDTEVRKAVAARRSANQKTATTPPAPPTLVLPDASPRSRTGTPPMPAVRPMATTDSAPPSSASRRDISKPILVLAVVLAVAVVAVYVTLINLQVFHKASPTAQPPTPSATATVTTTAGGPTQTVTVTSSPTTDAETVAYNNLSAQAQIDLAPVEAILQNQWAALLATKELGTLPDGSSWTYSAIWQLYQNLNQTYGSVLLVRGNTFSSPGLGQQWFLMAYGGTAFGTAQAALDWCNRQGLVTDEECIAFRFTNTPGNNEVKH